MVIKMMLTNKNLFERFSVSSFVNHIEDDNIDIDNDIDNDIDDDIENNIDIDISNDVDQRKPF